MVNPYYARLGFREEGDHWVADLSLTAHRCSSRPSRSALAAGR